MPLYIGIDGGGTKTEALLLDENLRILHRIVGGATNPNDCTVEISVSHLTQIIKTILKDNHAAVPENDIYVYGGIAGAGNHGKELHDGLKKAFPNINLAIVTDAMLPLCAEFGNNNGACIICGTGSVCYLRLNGTVSRIGGWGYLIDNGGSGYNIGSDVLDAALRFYDGRQNGSELLYNLIRLNFGMPVENLISEVYEKGKPYIASFASLAFEGIKLNDCISSRIIDKCCVALSEYVSAAYKKAGQPLDVVFGGGLISTYKNEMLQRINRLLLCPCTLTVSQTPPVFGAVLSAVSMNDDNRKNRYTKNQFISEYNIVCSDKK